jgi:multicomponent Na+:H+ antiporter subunit D
MILDNLPAILIVLPLLGAPLCLLLGRPTLCWGLSLAITWASFAVAIALLLVVWNGEAIEYPLGGWPGPWGIVYFIDPANAFILFIVTGISAVLLPYALKSVKLEVPENRQHLFYSLYLLCQTGLMGIAITGDAFNVFVFLEISSLSSYALIALGNHRKALTSAFTYLIMGTIGATFILIGIGLIYMMTGTLNMLDIHDRLGGVGDTGPVLAAFAFITVGVILKLALFPLHLWMPNAYAYAPSAVSAFIAATATKVSIYVLLRFIFTVFGEELVFAVTPLNYVLMVPSIMAMFAGSLVAIFQTDIKRMLAYSSVAQIGYIVLGISLISASGITASFLHIFNHALMKAALFAVMGCIFFRMSSVRLSDMAGIAREMPITFGCFVVGGLSLIGVPLTGGFISKFYLIKATLELDLWWVSVLILASSLLAIIYVWRVIEVMYFKPAPEGRIPATEAPLSMLIPTLVLAAANIYFGIETSLPIGVSEAAASGLLTGAW